MLLLLSHFIYIFLFSFFTHPQTQPKPHICVHFSLLQFLLLLLLLLILEDLFSLLLLPQSLLFCRSLLFLLQNLLPFTMASDPRLERIAKSIRVIPDFPKPGALRLNLQSFLLCFFFFCIKMCLQFLRRLLSSVHLQILPHSDLHLTFALLCA